MRFVMALAMLLITAPSFADESFSPPAFGPLPPGRPAGVAEASNHDLFVWISLGMIAVTIAGVALTVHTGGSSAAAPVTTNQ